MNKSKLNVGFICKNCNNSVLSIPKGSYRNHCPHCLFSLHVDDEIPGDRASNCKGLMEPVGMRYHAKKGIQLLHRCISCGKQQYNIICESICQPDNQELIQQLMYLNSKEKYFYATRTACINFK